MPMAELTVEVTQKTRVPVKWLRAECGVRYWEDATVNGVEDTEGTLIPCRHGDAWQPLIDLATGKIDGWPPGTTASIHYKVCDDGAYELLSVNKTVVARREGYVIAMMCPEGRGYGDYVIMDVGPDGVIAKWAVDLRAFEEPEDD